MKDQALHFLTDQSGGILKEVIDASLNNVIDDEMTDCHMSM